MPTNLPPNISALVREARELAEHTRNVTGNHAALLRRLADALSAPKVQPVVGDEVEARLREIAGPHMDNCDAETGHPCNCSRERRREISRAAYRLGLAAASEDAAKEDADILTVAVERDAIVVRLPFATVPYAVSAAPWNTDDDCNQRYEVTSVQAFAAEVVHALKNEEEDGTTLVHVMFDAAFEYVVEQGGEGIDAIRAARKGDARGEG